MVTDLKDDDDGSLFESDAGTSEETDSCSNQTDFMLFLIEGKLCHGLPLCSDPFPAHVAVPEDYRRSKRDTT